MWGLLRESSTISTSPNTQPPVTRLRVGAPSGVLDDFNNAFMGIVDPDTAMWGLLRESSTISTSDPSASARCIELWGLLRESSTISTRSTMNPSKNLSLVGAPSGVLDDFNSTVRGVLESTLSVGAPSGVLDDFNIKPRCSRYPFASWGLLRESSTISTLA